MPIDQNQTTSNKKTIDDSQSKILKNLSARLTDDYFNKKNFPLRTAGISSQDEARHIDDFIKQSAKRIAGKEDEYTKELKTEVSPQKFNGVSGVDEERTLLKEQLKHLERENTKLKHELDLLKVDYEEDKKQLSLTIRDLKSELHRTAPLTDNKFFTFSKDLREVVDSVKALTQEGLGDEVQEIDIEPHDFNEISAPPTVSIDLPVTAKAEKSPATEPKQIEKIEGPKKLNDFIDDSQKKPTKKPGVSKKVKTIIATSTVVAIATFTLGTFALNQKPAVNQKVVDEYLENSGQVQGIVSDKSEVNVSPTPSLVRKEFKNNQVTFEETKWEVFRDEFLGFQIEYPGNAADLLHTGNTITFLRKEGYLFKMQRLQSSKTLEEYWESVKDTGLTYKVEKEKIGIQNALHLILEEEVDFPGNRYLLKINDHIYDLWYATPNPAFDDGDMKRVEYMLSKMRFI